jgi:hypothetical protein
VRFIGCSFGVEQTVKIVETVENKYVIKIPFKGNEIMILREAFACEKLRNNKFVPQIVLQEKYIIESCLAGKILSKTRLSAEEKKNVYIALGKVVRKIHRIEMRGFGELGKNLQGKHLTLERHIDFLLLRDMPLLLQTGLLSAEEITAIRVFLKKHCRLPIVRKRCCSILI